MTNQYLFELGTEEIPADMIAPALDQLQRAFEELLNESGIACRGVSSYATPRRLALIADGLPDRQQDRSELVVGPPRTVAFDATGRPTPAAVGFARKVGVEVERLHVAATEKGEYVAVEKQIIGESVPTILSKAMPGIIAAITWPKNMYWRESRYRFIRPLRWFVSLWNEQIVDFEFEGVRAGRTTSGHRLLGRSAIELNHPREYLDRLRENLVLADVSERRSKIELELRSFEADDRTVVADSPLMETVVQLNEFPSVLMGSFNPAFLEIPREVLVTVMRFHQKYFALRDKNAELLPCFLTVVNTAGDPEGLIRAGHEKVLKARLQDAAFFWESDTRESLESRVKRLDHVLFQEKLGSYLDKTNRVRSIGRSLGVGNEIDTALMLCKADLTTEMVREFPELQGVMGGLYARRQGYPEAVWKAIYEQYRPGSMEDQVPASSEGALVSVIDRIDTIVGCFGVDIAPSGSSDPFGLRRQAQGLIRILLEHKLELSVSKLVRVALENSPPASEREVVETRVMEFLEQRIRFVLQREGIPYDIQNAVLAAGFDHVAGVLLRSRALTEMKGQADFDGLAVAFRRTKNILGGRSDFGDVQEKLFEEREEGELYRAFLDLKPRVEGLVKTQDYSQALKEMAGIRSAVDHFFERVLVMADDPEVRHNRLALLHEISRLFLGVADISEIVQQQGEVNDR